MSIDLICRTTSSSMTGLKNASIVSLGLLAWEVSLSKY
jgi:hypothetical protein